MIKISELNIAVLCVCTLTGCMHQPELTLLDVQAPLTLAVAPALNHSGSEDFDPVRVADLMASELTHFPGVKVIPVSRTLAQLASEGKARVESPAHALQVLDRLGADGMVVFAVTEYDPYWPPVVGISAQIFGHGPLGGTAFDPVSSSRQSSPVESRVGKLPRAECQRIFNGREKQVEYEIRDFARERDAEDSPHGWRKFLATQEDFLRFCCHSVLGELIRQEVTHVVAQVERRNEGAQR